MNPNPPRPVTLIARWRNFAVGSKTIHGHRKAHVYTLATWPSKPLEIGEQVRVLAISSKAFHSPCSIATDLDTYDPHVVGSIAKIVASKNGRARVTVVNECRRSNVGIVEVDVPNVRRVLQTTQASKGTDRTFRTGEERATSTEEETVKGPQLVGECEVDTGCVMNPCAGQDCPMEVYAPPGDPADEGARDWTSDEDVDTRVKPPRRRRRVLKEIGRAVPSPILLQLYRDGYI